MSTLPAQVHTIPEALAFWASSTPDSPALIVPGSPPITYGALWAMARELAESLRRGGIEGQGRVVLLLPDGPQLAIGLLGTMSAAMAAPLSVALTSSELVAALQGLRATAAIVTPEVAPVTRQSLLQNRLAIFALREHVGLEAITREETQARTPNRMTWSRPQDIAVVLHTSGTTGTPKRVPHTHHLFIEDGKDHRDLFGLSPQDRVPAVESLTLPLGLFVLTKAIAAGAGLIFPDTTDLPRMWESIAAERPTWMYCSPGYLELLARLLRERPALPAPSSLRFVRVSSAPLSLEVCEELETRLGAPILPSYGTSEAGRITAVLPPPAPRKPGSAGRPVQEVRIVADDGSDVGPGVAGEIWVRGPLVFAGYLDDPENNAAKFTADGWFRTGDLGYLDADGFFFLTGRINELINRGGTKIVPVEVDEALLDHPAVAEAAVFGVPDARLGEDIVAAVVLKPGLDATAREFRGWLLDRLSPHKVPRRIWFVAELPRTASGKVQRRVLADRFSNRQTASG
jgi:acyl-CoA synthetase (AMP-forming)/AMP-acid ligase II